MSYNTTKNLNGNIYDNQVMSGVTYDNGVSVGHEESFTASVTSWRWIATVSGWKLTLEHTNEFTDPAAKLRTYKAENRDIVTMSSLARVVWNENRIGEDPSLWNHINAHSMVSFKDGTRWEVVINGCNADQKKAIISSLMKNSWPYQVQRALYADSDASNNFLDGIWIADKNTGSMRYSHPDKGDVFTNPNANSPAEVKNNMPGVMVYYAETA